MGGTDSAKLFNLLRKFDWRIWKGFFKHLKIKLAGSKNDKKNWL